MGVFNWWWRRERRDSTLKDPERWLLDALLGSEATASGQVVPWTVAIGLPDVFACAQVIAQDVARTPLKLQAVSAGNAYDAIDHELWEVLHDLPNPETTAYEFRYDLVWDLLTHEAAYAEIRRAPGSRRILGLWRLDPDRVSVGRDQDGVKRWTYRRDDGTTFLYRFNPDTPPLLHLRMRSPIRRVRETLGLLSAVERYGAKFFANGARLSGVFSAPAGTPQNAYDELKAQLRLLFTGTENAHRHMTTRGELKYTPFTSPNDEAQFIETRKYLRTLIAGAFRVPPHKIGDLERATFSNITQQEIEYVNGALGPQFTAWAQALRRDVLTTRQYPRYDVVFDITDLIEGDLLMVSEALSKQVDAGIITINEARRRLRMNTVAAEIGDVHLVNGNKVPVTSAHGTASPSAPAAVGAQQVM
jgi:HK97 family phage portal protein